MVPSFATNDEEAGMKLLEDLTSNAKQVQEKVLEEILIRNANTEYLRRFLNGQSDKKLFKQKVPVVSYEDMRPYIDRIANGEASDVISAHPITEFMLSSGTSGGKPKMMPSVAEDSNRKMFIYNLRMLLIKKHVDGIDQGKGMLFLFTIPETKTPSGLAARTVTTSYYRSKNFKNRPLNWYNTYTSPDETILCPDNKQSTYCQLLSGLVQRNEVVRVGSVFAYTFVRVIKFLEDHWQELCSNIRTGHVSDWITDPGCRSAVALILGKPNPELADTIERECSQRSWEGIVQKLWPRTKCIETVITGSMSQYVPILEFYTGGLPFISTTYGSSECFFGINLEPICNPFDVSYTIIPNMAYFEFLPIEKNKDEDTDTSCVRKEDWPVDLVDVKVGHYYEPVVTTFSGLYRFKVGDVLKVTGFHNNTPQFQVVQRKSVVLSIDGEKTTEEDLLKGVTRAKLLLEPLGLLLMDFTTRVDASSVPGHYVLFWELITKNSNHHPPKLDREKMEECCFTVEESLDSFYRMYRKKQSIGALEIKVVKQGTFDALMDFFISQGASMSHYKTPRCVKSEKALEILDSGVVANFFSKKAPSWESFEA